MKVETYQMQAANGKSIRKATRVVFDDGEAVNFTELIRSKKDAVNQAIVVRRFIDCTPFPLSHVIVEKETGYAKRNG